MTHIKDIRVAYIDSIPMEKSGIEKDVPAHVKLIWIDVEGRVHSKILDFTNEEVKEICNINDSPNESD